MLSAFACEQHPDAHQRSFDRSRNLPNGLLAGNEQSQSVDLLQPGSWFNSAGPHCSALHRRSSRSQTGHSNPHRHHDNQDDDDQNRLASAFLALEFRAGNLHLSHSEQLSHQPVHRIRVLETRVS